MVLTPETGAGPAQHAARSILLAELMQGRPICVRCGSSSMRPQIVPGDMLTIAPVSLDPIQRGDIVLMGAGEAWIVHRLLAIREKNGRKYAVTRGDNVNRLDTPVRLECILGKVTGIRRNDRERILKSSCPQRLKTWLALVKLQVLDHAQRVVNVLRRIKHSRESRATVCARTAARDCRPPSFIRILEGANPFAPLVTPKERLAADDCFGWLNRYKKPNLDELLLQCSLPAVLRPALQAGLPAQDNLAELFQAIKAAVGWERFLKIADVEGLSELICCNVRQRMTGDAIPSDVCRHLEHTYVTTLARNTLFLAKLDQIAHALAGLDFIVLKGAYLASHVYASPGLRRFSDMDILVKRADLAEIDLRLAQIGYQPADCIAGLRGNGKISSFLNSVMYYPAGNEIAIDVHWHLLNSYLSHYLNATVDIGEIWQAARPSTSAGWELCPEHLIVHLAEHALHHSFERLILLRDIAEVIIRFGAALDWNRLVGECLKFNLARPVFYSLLFISRKTNVPVPDTALAALRPARLGRAERLFISLALRGQRYPELCHLAYFDSMASFGAKIRFVLRLVFPCREVMALTYSKRAHEIGPGVYILRLSHGIGYLTRAMFHFICRWTKRASGIKSAGLV